MIAVVYQLRILAQSADVGLDDLVEDAESVISADGVWREFFEVRMSAGPAVRVERQGKEAFAVSVSWGTQNGHVQVADLRSAIECADRMAYAFYEMRRSGLISD
jgi:hypothetical protein